jgi:hypothetical protein
VNTLAQYATLSTDALVKGVAQTIIKDFPLLARLPFKDIVGNSLLYNLESAEAGAQWYQTGDTWTESSPTWAQRSVALVTLGGDADIDKFAKKTRSNVMDLEAEILTLKAKAIANEFGKQFIVGGTTTTPQPNSFKGLLQLMVECESTSTVDLDGVNNAMVVPAHATSATLTLLMLDQLCDTIKGGKPDFLMMSKRMRRKVTSLCLAAGGNLTYTTGIAEIGLQLPAYNGVPILINDFILDNYPDNSSSVLTIASYAQATARAATLDNSPIFAFQLGEGGLCGLQNGGLEVTPLGELETKRASRFRMAWDCGLALFNTVKAAVLIGATDGT